MLSGVGINVQRNEGVGPGMDGHTNTYTHTDTEGCRHTDRELIALTHIHTQQRCVKSQCTFGTKLIADVPAYLQHLLCTDPPPPQGVFYRLLYITLISQGMYVHSLSYGMLRSQELKSNCKINLYTWRYGMRVFVVKKPNKSSPRGTTLGGV